jgi:hypothetical protein
MKMIRKLKTLGVAAFAVLALSAVGASAAHATNFTASAYPTSFTGVSEKGNDTFATEAGNVECKSHFSGTETAASETVTVTPVYSECRAFGFLSATVNMNGCDYVFHTNGEVDVECSGANKIVIIGGTCETTIGTQTGLKSVILANGVGDMTAQANVGGIAYTVTKDGFACPFNGLGAKAGATYTQHKAVTVQSTSGTTIDIG